MKERPVFYPIEDQEVSQDLLDLRRDLETREAATLSPDAAFSKDHNRYCGGEEDHRLPYKRDVDRIVYSKAYSRYIDKTQVVYLVENDHVTHRILHVQLVSSFARGIAQILGLNLDLVEAIALGHDVGHPPFGHEGEGYLSKIAEEYGHGLFSHPVQSCRLFRLVEPLNLGLAVYDGFLCHDGGLNQTVLEPDYGKTWETFQQQFLQKKSNPDVNLLPGTLEGCLVKMCDTVSYLGRDLEDAVSLGIISRDEVPESILGKTNREILRTVAADIIKKSQGKNYIAISETTLEAIQALRQFNFDRIYGHPKLKVESQKIQRSYRLLFGTLLHELEQDKENSYIWKNYLHDRSEPYLAGSSNVEMVVDYIAGMTDGYFVSTLEKLIVPEQIDISCEPSS